MTLTWKRHFERNGGLNQILRRQTSRFHYVYINISAKDYERSLREVTLSIVNWDTCNEAIENAPEKSTYKLTGNMICAGGGTDHDACQVCLLFRSQGNSTVLFSYLVRYQLFFNCRAGSG